MTRTSSRHRDDHLPVVLGLRLLARLELDARQLRDAVDELGDLVAELVAHVVERRVGVLDDVVEERGGDRLLVEVQAREDQRDAVRVVDEVLAGAPLLPVVRRRGEAERAAQQLAIDVRVVGRDLREQLFDKALISLVKLENRHESSVLRAVLRTCPRRKGRCDGEVSLPMLKRWREKRKLLELARAARRARRYGGDALGGDRQRGRLREQRLEALRLEQAAPDAAVEVELREDLLRDRVALLRPATASRSQRDSSS